MKDVKNVKELYLKLSAENRRKFCDYADKLNPDFSEEDFRNQEVLQDFLQKDAQ